MLSVAGLLSIAFSSLCALYIALVSELPKQLSLRKKHRRRQEKKRNWKRRLTEAKHRELDVYFFTDKADNLSFTTSDDGERSGSCSH